MHCVSEVSLKFNDVDVLVFLTFGHANLLRHLHNLNLDIDLYERFGERVDLDETRVDGASETTELGDETNVTLLDGLVWVRAANAARDRTESTDGGTQSVDHAAVPAGARGILSISFDDLRIRWLKVFATRWLHVDDGVVGTSGGCGKVAVRRSLDGVAATVGLGKAHCGDSVVLLGCLLLMWSVDWNGVDQ